MTTPPIHSLWYICLIVRFLFGVYIINRARICKILNICDVTHNIITLALTTMSIGFAFQWLFHNPNKPEFQIARVWWNSDRPIHAGILAMSAIMHHVGYVSEAGSLFIADAVFSIVNRCFST